MPAPPEPLETQVDRTVLAWGRTAATVAVVALLFARWTHRMGPIALLPAILGLTAAVLIGVWSRVRGPLRRAQFASGDARPPLGTAAAICSISVLLAAAGLAGLFLS